MITASILSLQRWINVVSGNTFCTPKFGWVIRRWSLEEFQSIYSFSFFFLIKNTYVPDSCEVHSWCFQASTCTRGLIERGGFRSLDVHKDSFFLFSSHRFLSLWWCDLLKITMRCMIQLRSVIVQLGRKDWLSSVSVMTSKLLTFEKMIFNISGIFVEGKRMSERDYSFFGIVRWKSHGCQVVNSWMSGRNPFDFVRIHLLLMPSSIRYLYDWFNIVKLLLQRLA